MQLPSFNYLHPKTFEDGQAASRLLELRQKLDDTKEVFAAHTKDGVVLSTPQDQSIVLQGVKTPDGSLTGVYRKGQDGSEDLAAQTVTTQTDGTWSYDVPHRISLHKDANSPQVLLMSEMDGLGAETTFTINQSTGEVTTEQRKVPLDADPAEPFNYLHPKTLGDALGALELQKLNAKIDEARSTLSEKPPTRQTAEDQSIVVEAVPTIEGHLTGVLRDGKDTSTDMETLTRHTESDGCLSHDVFHGLSKHHEANSPIVNVGESWNRQGQSYVLNEATGIATPGETKLDFDELDLTPHFNYLHPKTLTDALGIVKLTSAEKEVDETRTLLVSHPTHTADGVIYASDVSVGKDDLSGHYEKSADGSENLQAELTHVDSDSGYSFQQTRRVGLHADAAGREITLTVGHGYGDKFTINDQTGEVTDQELKPEPKK